MARYNFITNLDKAGYKVYIYTKFTNQSAKIYTTDTSTTIIQSLPQITTSSNGLVSFWVDTSDYSYNQRFNIEIYDVLNNHYSTLSDVSIFDVQYYDASNPLPIDSGGTGNTTGTISGAQADITSLGGITTPITIAEGGTGNTAGTISGAQGGITSLGGLTTPITIAEGGTGNTAGTISGAQGGITSLGGLTTALKISEGGTGNITGDAPTLDTFSASQTPAANQIPVLDVNGNLIFPNTAKLGVGNTSLQLT